MGVIVWTTKWPGSEVGTVRDKELFTLDHPGTWSRHFVLTGPLVPGSLNVIELPAPREREPYLRGTRPSRKRIREDFQADQMDWALMLGNAKAVAETILIDFAKAVLQGVDEPSQIG